MDQDSPCADEGEGVVLPQIVARPSFQLRSLPVQIRWEVTRRHPYYQAWWNFARRHYQNSVLESEYEIPLRQLAAYVLAKIGVSGTPIDPKTEFTEIGAEDLNVAWLSGAVHPLSLRSMAAILIAAFPSETAIDIGMLLSMAGSEDVDGEPPQRIQALQRLASLERPGLDDYPDEPFVSVNPAASGRQINEAIAMLLKTWKAERGLTEQRDRSEKYFEYLKIWDLREGWVGGAYDRTKERTLKEIATETKLSPYTLHNQYGRAFEMITGHGYSPELWCRLMGQLKLAELIEDTDPRLSRKRPIFSPVRRPAPETSLRRASSKAAGSALVTNNVTATDPTDVNKLIEGILKLIGQGHSDQEILDEFDLSAKAQPAVASLRSRDIDGLAAQK